MTRSSKALIVLVIAALGLWGCAQGPASQSAGNAERIRSLEAKCVKLEDDYRAVAGEKERLRKQVAGLDAENGRLEKVRQQLQKEVDQLKAVVKERDQLRQTVEARTGERDALQVRCEKMKKGLQALIGQDDAMLPNGNQAAPVSAVPASLVRPQL
jgi:septal ring factor EnvC (AmiA/AmiB activator)